MMVPPEVRARRQREFDEARNAYEIDKLHSKWAAEDRAIKEAEDYRAKQVVELEARVAQLERRLAIVEPIAAKAQKRLDPDGPHYREMVAFIREAIIKHVQGGISDLLGGSRSLGEAIGKALEERAFLADAGVWAEARSYRIGDVVSHGGAAWAATVSGSGLQPGEGPGWRMIAKSNLSELRRMVGEEIEKSNKNKRPVSG
jgi:hypothetical protein